MKHFLITSLAIVLASFPLSGKDIKKQKAIKEPTDIILLYPEGQNVDCGIVENGKQITSGPRESNECTGPERVSERGNISNTGDSARMRIFLPHRPNGQMVIVCPGGGYGNTAARHEGDWVAQWFTERGIAACVLIYRMPEKNHRNVPLTDVQNAFRYCRSHSDEWGIKQIGVMGFSAGGHLAACASTMFTDQATRPDFSILIYPVITLDNTYTHGGTMRKMTENGTRSDLIDYYSIENRVKADTPPAFLALSADDTGVPPEHSYRYLKSLRKFDIGAEMYVLPSGSHGWGWKTASHGEERLQNGVREVFFSALDNFLLRMSGQTRKD